MLGVLTDNVSTVSMLPTGVDGVAFPLHRAAEQAVERTDGDLVTKRSKAWNPDSSLLTVTRWCPLTTVRYCATGFASFFAHLPVTGSRPGRPLGASYLLWHRRHNSR